MILAHRRNTGRHIVFGYGVKDRHKAAHHEVVNLPFGFAHRARGHRERRNDGEVVADPGVIKDALIGFDPIARENLFRRFAK